MAVNLSPVGGVAAQFFTSTGAVLTGGKLYTYAAGTTTPATTYTTSQGTTAWTNPIVLDAAGRVSGSGEIWLTDGIIYKFVLKDANDVLIATYDNITGINSNAVAYTNQQEIVTATAGQTVFNLGISYQPGTNSLSVFVDGVNQYGPGAQYSYVETDSDTVTFNAGLHVGAEVKFTTTQQQGAGAVDAQQVTYDPPFTGSVPTNVEAKLAQTVSLEDFGAVGDGVADDTQALIDACAFIESSSNISVLNLSRLYSIDWLIIPNNYIEFTRDDVTICGGGTLLTRPAAYSAGVANGAFKYYTPFYFRGNRCTVQDITFDGNNQFSQYASSPSQPNYWFNAVYFQGVNTGNRTEGGKVINCRYINGSGWPFRGQFHNYGLIHGCYVEHSQGCGFDNGSLCVVSNNISYNAHDAHFATWNSLGGVISGNTCDTNDNGSGVDVSGSTDATVIGNTIRNNANRGIWVLADPNTGNQCKNVVISGNTLTVNNTYVPISERGDIQVGPTDVTTDPRPPGTVDCRGLVISGNNIFSRAGANAITLGKYAFYTNITGNVFSDDAGSAANRSIVLYNATNVIVRDNYDLIAIRKGASGQPKMLGTGPVWFDDANTSLDTSVVSPSALGDVQTNYFVQTNRRNAPGKTYQIVKQYAYTEFGAEFNSANGNVDVANIAFTAGGFEVADIELIVTVGADHGVRRTRVVYQGYAAVTPTQIVAAADEYSGGSVPPTVTFTASTGNVKISIGSNAVSTASFWMRVSGTSGTVPNVTALI